MGNAKESSLALLSCSINNDYTTKNPLPLSHLHFCDMYIYENYTQPEHVRWSMRSNNQQSCSPRLLFTGRCRYKDNLYDYILY